MNHARPAIVLLAIGLLLAACGSDGSDTGSDTTDGSSTASTDTSTSTSADDTTSSTSAETTASTTTTETTVGSIPGDVVYAVADPSQLPPPMGDDPANGSGCNPGEGDLPDGVWFGILTDVTDTSAEFDLACWFSGDAANEAATEDGETEVPVPNDYYIRNESDAIRTVPVAADAPTWVITGDPSAGPEELTWADWVADLVGYVPCPGEYCLAWLYVNDGTATEVVSQYTP